MNWKTVFNPFLKFDEKLLVAAGIVIFLLNILGCYYSESVNDSIFHYSRLDKNQDIWYILKINSLSYIFSVIILFILGKILNAKTRFVDIVNTVLISQIPLAVILPVGGLPFHKEALNSISENIGHPENIPVQNMAIITIWGLVTLILLIYSIILYYNGFKTATNIKKWQHIVLFAFISLILTLISQTLF